MRDVKAKGAGGTAVVVGAAAVTTLTQVPGSQVATRAKTLYINYLGTDYGSVALEGQISSGGGFVTCLDINNAAISTAAQIALATAQYVLGADYLQVRATGAAGDVTSSIEMGIILDGP